MKWFKNRVTGAGNGTEVLKQQHIVVLPPDNVWLLGNRLIRQILIADGRQVVVAPDGSEKREYRKFLKSLRATPSWVLAQADTQFISEIEIAKTHPVVAVLCESFEKDQASPVIRGLHPQRVVLCADGSNFEAQARLIQKGTSMITVGHGRAKYQIKEFQTTPNGTALTLISPLGRQEIAIPTIRDSSVCEIAMAIAVVNELGCSSRAIISGMQQI